MSTSPRRDSDDLDHGPSESTPLLTRDRGNEDAAPSSAQGKRSLSKAPWPSLIALGVLSVAAIIIMLIGFLLPQAAQEYAVQAATLDLDSVVPEFTKSGIRARVRGTFVMDSSRVQNGFIRKVGVFSTWIAREVETGQAQVEVSLPEYDNINIGTAFIPPVRVDIRNGRQNFLDLPVDLEPPSKADGVRSVLDDWVEGRLDHLRVLGAALVKIRSGVIRLPTQKIIQAITIKGNNIPETPQFNVTRLNFHDAVQPGDLKGMAADAAIAIKNNFPLDLEVPPLKFDILVPNCRPNQPYIRLADAAIKPVHIFPKKDVSVNATGFVHELSESLTDACPRTGKSPLDTLLGGYVRGNSTTIYVRGSKAQAEGTPKWLSGLISEVTVPVPFAGHTFENVIHNFSLTDVEFSLPGFFAEPDSPEASPKISANINAWITLPEEMNFDVDVQNIRATADILYKKKKMGELNLRKWQEATSKRVDNPKGNHPFLVVESAIKNAPVTITDDDVFSDVVQALLFGGKAVTLAINANVDVEIGTTLGILTVREIPASGKVPVDPLSGGGGFSDFKPTIHNMSVVDSTKDSMIIEANISATNPTNYSATIPYVDVDILANNTVIGHATATDLNIRPGPNENLLIRAVWGLPGSSPPSNETRAVGRELLSQFVSGYNISIDVRTHNGTFPALPKLGQALNRVNISVPAPRLRFPKDPDSGDDDEGDDEKKPRFIRSATMHLFSSSAEFTLISPLMETIIYITTINATAFYKGSEVGSILYELPFAVPPGSSITPRLPVDWDLGSVGYDAVRKALGGELKLQAEANVGVKIGSWQETLWYKGKGIGAKVRL